MTISNSIDVNPSINEPQLLPWREMSKSQTNPMAFNQRQELFVSFPFGGYP